MLRGGEDGQYEGFDEGAAPGARAWLWPFSSFASAKASFKLSKVQSLVFN
jgi:hypothetical protein